MFLCFANTLKPGKKCIKNACNKKPECKECLYCRHGQPELAADDNSVETGHVDVKRSDEDTLGLPSGVELQEAQANPVCNSCSAIFYFSCYNVVSIHHPPLFPGTLIMANTFTEMVTRLQAADVRSEQPVHALLAVPNLCSLEARRQSPGRP